MKASILIPVFNREKTIKRTLNSVAHQKNISEIIVVDDCSTDKTSEHIESLKINNLIYIRLDKKMNGNVARNVAARSARGDILIFLDSDDEFCPSRVDNLLAYYEHNNDAEVVVDSFVTERRGDRKFFVFKKAQIDSQSLFEGLVCNSIPLTFSSISVRKECFESMGGLDELTLRHQDRDFLLTAISKGKKIHTRNVADLIKHQGDDSFSRSAVGYMRALEWLAKKHHIFLNSDFFYVKKYLILRSLIGSLIRLEFRIYAENYFHYKNSKILFDGSGLSVKYYFKGKKFRKRIERNLIGNDLKFQP